MSLVLRSVKNAELTWSEVDGNFLYLENKIDKLAESVNGGEVLRVTSQDFLPEQQNQARENIEAVSVQQLSELTQRVDDLEDTPAEQTIQDITIEEESQIVDVRLNKNIVRFNSVFAGCTISPGSKNGDTLVILNNAVSETPFNINIPVILKSLAESDIFSVAPNKNYMFWFDLAVDRWIDVSL